MSPREFHLGATRSLDGQGVSTAHSLPMQRLMNHGVIVGMSGSGKTGLITVLVEEALRARVPVLMLDVKGDLPICSWRSLHSIRRRSFPGSTPSRTGATDERSRRRRFVSRTSVARR